MKIIAAYDANSVIKAAAVVDGRRGPVPVATEHTKVDVFDVPLPGEGVYELRLDEVCATFRVDTGSQRLVNMKETPTHQVKRP